MKLKKSDMDQYILDSCGKCIKCAGQVFPEELSVLEDIKRTKMHCVDCGFKWIEVWKLVALETA